MASRPLDTLDSLIAQTARSLRVRLSRELKVRGYQVTVEQLALLVQLWDRDGRPQQELADLLAKDKSTTTRLLHGIERLGLVERRTGLVDARQRELFLTDAGQRLMWEVTELSAALLTEARTGIPPGQLLTCMNVLRKLRRNLNNPHLTSRHQRI